MKNAFAYAALVVAFVGGLAAAATHPARADLNAEGEYCAEAQALMKKANSSFGEKVQWTGKSAAGFRYVLMASDHTWTFIIIDNKADADGDYEACVKASDGVPATHEGT